MEGGTSRQGSVPAQRPHDAEPWMADFRWDRRGAVNLDGDTGFWGMYVAGFLCLLALMFQRHAQVYLPWVFGSLAWLAVFAAAVSLVTGVVCGFRDRKHGESRLAFARFPFFLGETLDVEFQASSRILPLGNLSFTLRCVERSRSGDYDSKTSSVDRWREVVVAAAPAEKIPLTFRLPEDANLTTSQRRGENRRWELSVTASTPGSEFRATFLVPVYARDYQNDRGCEPGLPPCGSARGTA